jgi:hypothetical protein
MIGATHAAGVAIDRHGQTSGHRAAMAVQFIDGKINPEVGATGAALLAL